ncbi:MAG: TIGR00269 family protein [Candidatus Woesearchaeota archaeon]
MRCSYCLRPAIYLRKIAYCADHFESYFVGKVKRTIKRYALLCKTDKIVVACSGGKDSTVALELVSRIYRDVEAVAIDEGICGYREHTLDWLKKYCYSNQIPLRVYSFEKEFGFRLDNVKDKKRLCTCCGVLRRYLLNSKSKGFDKVVTGHNLDDEAQSIFMNLSKANVEALVRLGPMAGVVRDNKFVPRVKPLYMCLEKEDVVFAYLKGFEMPRPECPYASSSYRADVKAGLNELEASRPGTKENLVKSFLRVLPRLRADYRCSEEVKSCAVCGEPCRADVCASCNIVKFKNNRFL